MRNFYSFPAQACRDLRPPRHRRPRFGPFGALLPVLLVVGLFASGWPALRAGAQGAVQPPPRNAPVLAWYYAEFSQGPAQDIANAQRAGIDALIVSQSTQHPGVPLFNSPIAKAAEGTNIALTLGIETNLVYQTQDELVSELRRILRDEAPRPRFLRFRGKPVIVFWQLPSIKTLPGQTPQAAWESVRQQVDPGRTSIWIGEGGDPAPGTGTLTYLPAFDGLHLYSIAWDAEPGRALSAWAQRTRSAPGNKLWAATVMPGGYYADGPPPWKHRDRENGAFFERAWRGALATNPDMVILTSLDEDNEATAIHPHPEWGTLYLDINRRFADEYHAQHGDTAPVVVPTPVPAGPTPVPVTVAPAAGSSMATARIKADTPTTLSVDLPTGQQARVTISAGTTSALKAAQPNVDSVGVDMDLAPIVSVPMKPYLVGGGGALVAQDGLDIKMEMHDANDRPLDVDASLSGARVDVTLPYQQPAQPGTEFHWLYEVVSNGEFLGYTWSPTETLDVASGTVTFSLGFDEFQGTLFLPTIITPGYVQNHDPLVHVWSGPTREARDFGFAGPQFTTFTVVAPQVADRLFVFSPVVGNYAWIDAAGCGPSGPP
jgi:hypothetical protein